MGWPYEFLDLSHEQKLARRHTLDTYAAIAHFSALAPAVVFLAVRAARRVERTWRNLNGGINYQQLPRSPVVKANRLSTVGGLGEAWRKFAWWMSDDVYFAGWHWGQRDEWVLGTAWTLWLVLLCVLGTGRGKSHLIFISSHVVS